MGGPYALSRQAVHKEAKARVWMAEGSSRIGMNKIISSSVRVYHYLILYVEHGRKEIGSRKWQALRGGMNPFWKMVRDRV